MEMIRNMSTINTLLRTFAFASLALLVAGAATGGDADNQSSSSEIIEEEICEPYGSSECTNCIWKWCDYECDGIGDECASCMARWCSFECGS